MQDIRNCLKRNTAKYLIEINHEEKNEDFQFWKKKTFDYKGKLLIIFRRASKSEFEFFKRIIRPLNRIYVDVYLRITSPQK